MSYEYPLESFQVLWESNPLVIMDTNVFLNLYRYSPETTEAILSVLDSIPEEQIWIPAQVLEEYNTNKQDVIKKNHTKYKAVTREINRIMLTTENDISKQFNQYTKFKFPKVNELEQTIKSSIMEIKAKCEKYEKDIRDEVARNTQMLQDDKINTFINKLVIHNNIGKPFSFSQLLNIYNEGEQRYKYKIPPGYMDEIKDKTDPTKRQKFGDLIMWKQILEHAKIQKSNVIFLTLDEKEDWWILDKDKRPIRPRDELFSEFMEYSNQELVIMNLTNFYNHTAWISNIQNCRTFIEINADSLSKSFIKHHFNWLEVLNSNENLYTYFRNFTDIVAFNNNILDYLKIYAASQPEIEIEIIDFNENEAYLKGHFSTNLKVQLSESSPFDPLNPPIVYYAEILFLGSIEFYFEVDYTQSDNYVKTNTLKGNIYGFTVFDITSPYHQINSNKSQNLCNECGEPNAEYLNYYNEPVCAKCMGNYDACSECGKLFLPEHLNGGICSQCEKVEVY